MLSIEQAEVLIALRKTDPCVLVDKLDAILLALSTGGAVQKIEFRDRSTWFHQSNIQSLRDYRNEIAGDCATISGKANQFAITLGGGRRRSPFGI